MRTVEAAALANFLPVARANGWASNKTVAEVGTTGRRTYEFRGGLWHYTDTFTGNKAFAGMEIVDHHNMDLWFMNYSGNILPEFHHDSELITRAYDLIKTVLLIPDKNLSGFQPRGPQIYQKGELFYICNFSGDISNFKGNEGIGLDWNWVYQGEFNGGEIIHH